MKNAAHPEYRTVVFRDQSADVKYLTRSTRTSEHSTTWEDGNVYPVIDVDVSSASAQSRARRAKRAESAGRAARRRLQEKVGAGRD